MNRLAKPDSVDVGAFCSVAQGLHAGRDESDGARLNHQAGLPHAATTALPGNKSNPLVWRVLIILLALAGCGATLWATRWGLGLRSDSAVYVAAARNLLAGHGLSWLSGGGEIRPMTLHAPLLSIILAGAEAIGVHAIAFARVLNAACLGLEVMLVGVLAKRMTRSSAFGLLAALVMAGTGEMLRVHAWLMSEPLFIVLTLAGVLALLQYPGEGRRLWIMLGSLAFGLAGLSRYGGLALPAAGALYLVLDSSTRWRRRLEDAALMLVIGFAPSAAWMARNYLLTGQTGGRSFGVHLELWPSLRDRAVAILLNWFAPLRLVEWIMDHEGLSALLVGLAGLGAVMLGALMMTRRARQAVTGDSQMSGVLLVVLCLLSYMGVLFFAALFSSPGADVDERVLSPVYPLLWLVLVAGLAWVWRRKRLALQVVVGLLVLFLVRNKLVYEYWTIRELSADGLGYASRAWQSSATIQEITALDPALIYTNDIAAVYLLAGRPSYVVPWALPDYDPDLAAEAEAKLHSQLVERGGAVVLFGEGQLPEGWTGEGFEPASRTADGVILLAVGGRSD